MSFIADSLRCELDMCLRKLGVRIDKHTILFKLSYWTFFSIEIIELTSQDAP